MLIAGLSLGAVYGLIGFGISLTYRVSGVANFAQGAFAMVGGVAALLLIRADIPLILALPLAVGTAMLAGYLLQRGLTMGKAAADGISVVAITAAAALLLQGLARASFGVGNATLGVLSDRWTLFPGVTVTSARAAALAVAIVLVPVVWLLLARTRFGKAMTAVSAGRLAARLSGIDAGRIVALAAVLSATIGAIAGLLAATMAPIDFSAGFGFLLNGFAAAMLGGMGSPLGAIAGGLILGVLEIFAATYLGASFRDATAFAVILAVLFLMPGRLSAPGAGRA